MARLEAELERLDAADPFRALELDYDADAAQIRARFLEITKRYHPSRFARMDRQVFRTANEVFLRLKAAYAELSDDDKRARLRSQHSPTVRAPIEEGRTQRGPAIASPRAPTERAPTAPAQSRARAPTGSTRRSGSGEREPRPSASMPQLKRPSTRIPRSPITRRGPGGTRRRPGTTDATEVAAALHDTVRRRNDNYELALKMLAGGRYADARQLLHKIAAEEPKTKKYRLQLHYAWGLEHEDAGRIEEARAEFQRAIHVDPAFRRAHEALDRLPGGKKGGGFFSKFFGR